MTLEIILGILVIAGTVAGTGLGYALSMRGKREEWKKEYREKRLAPLVDYVNAVMGGVFEHQLGAADINYLENLVDKSTNDKTRSVAEETLKEAAGKQTQISKQLHELHKSEAWRACIAATIRDKQLRFLVTKFENALGHFLFESTEKNLEELVNLGEQILDRADEDIVKGWKTPKV